MRRPSSARLAAALRGVEVARCWMPGLRTLRQLVGADGRAERANG
ncbi:MAG TPA: hypothetical protein VG248_00830 [Caulobacteraceae bacterium]|jgi:hypothetical protein|nr:hypothetical protein [Caulobacteraceae bacterium]